MTVLSSPTRVRPSRRTRALRLLLGASLVSMPLAVATAGSSSAAGTGCYTWVSNGGFPVDPSQPGNYTTWAYCPSGSGYFQVTAVCAIGGGGRYYTTGAVRRVGAGQGSGVQCPSAGYPLSRGYSTW